MKFNISTSIGGGIMKESVNKCQMLLHPNVGNHSKYTMDRMDPKAQRSGVISMVL